MSKGFTKYFLLFCILLLGVSARLSAHSNGFSSLKNTWNSQSASSGTKDKQVALSVHTTLLLAPVENYGPEFSFFENEEEEDDDKLFSLKKRSTYDCSTAFSSKLLAFFHSGAHKSYFSISALLSDHSDRYILLQVFRV
ncbi:MAG: hypothetical protein ACKOXB_07765 [Flavobacteriales bacterium]